MTATQAAERLTESVPSCSFHLRQLAKYGLAERAEGADARERPWRATALSTAWDDVSDDPATQAAVDQVNAVILEGYLKRAQAFLARRGDEPPQWRAATGFDDMLVYLTAPELAELVRKMDALVAEFDQRATEPSTRPEGARGVSLIRMAMTTPDIPVRPERAATTTKRPRAGKPRHTRRRSDD